MTAARIRKISLAIAGATAIGAAATGVTYAVTPGAAVYGCTNSHGTLRLLSSHGKCTHGYKKTAIGKQGPRGAKGAKGATGKSGPGAMAMKVDTTGTKAVSLDRALPGMGLTMHAQCETSFESKFILIDTSSQGPYEARGTSYYSGTSGEAYLVNPDGPVNLPDGTGLISFQQDAAKAQAGLSIGNGQLTADLLVVRGTKTATVQLYLNQAKDHCAVEAHITPSA